MEDGTQSLSTTTVTSESAGKKSSKGARKVLIRFVNILKSAPPNEGIQASAPYYQKELIEYLDQLYFTTTYSNLIAPEEVKSLRLKFDPEAVSTTVITPSRQWLDYNYNSIDHEYKAITVHSGTPYPEPDGLSSVSSQNWDSFIKAYRLDSGHPLLSFKLRLAEAAC